MVYFITFANKVSKERAKQIIDELRRLYPGQTFVFSPRPPRGRKLILELVGEIIILTIPGQGSKQEGSKKEDSKEELKQAKQEPTQHGFTLSELIAKHKKA